MYKTFAIGLLVTALFLPQSLTAQTPEGTLMDLARVRSGVRSHDAVGPIVNYAATVDYRAVREAVGITDRYEAAAPQHRSHPGGRGPRGECGLRLSRLDPESDFSPIRPLR